MKIIVQAACISPAYRQRYPKAVEKFLDYRTKVRARRRSAKLRFTGSINFIFLLKYLP